MSVSEKKLETEKEQAAETIGASARFEGLGLTPCPACSGDGYAGRSFRRCSRCFGSGFLPKREVQLELHLGFGGSGGA